MKDRESLRNRANMRNWEHGFEIRTGLNGLTGKTENRTKIRLFKPIEPGISELWENRTNQGSIEKTGRTIDRFNRSWNRGNIGFQRKYRIPIGKCILDRKKKNVYLSLSPSTGDDLCILDLKSGPGNGFQTPSSTKAMPNHWLKTKWRQEQIN